MQADHQGIGQHRCVGADTSADLRGMAAADDLSGDVGDHSAGWDWPDHDGVGGDPAVVADGAWAQDLGSGGELRFFAHVGPKRLAFGVLQDAITALWSRAGGDAI